MDHYDRLPEDLHQLAPEMLHYNLQALPVHLQAELHRKEQAACETVRQMSIAYGHMLNARQMQLTDELFSTMYRHLNAQAEVFRGGDHCSPAEQQQQQQQKADLDAIRQNKEEAMMVAATQFMATLPEMTLVVHRHIEVAFFDGY
ncbi:hypothetical protein TYRP_008551 [Tyrophagus putrescentiae]|nr:hypothetical protein TYRP_008551 [Tyrophagus putrescentiae]